MDEEPTNPLHGVPNISVATKSPGAIDAAKKIEITQAQLKATRLYPGPVGELVAKELSDYAKFGFRFDQAGFSERLLQQVLETEL